MVGAANIFSADLVFLSSDLSTSMLFGCFRRKVELVLALSRDSSGYQELWLIQPKSGC